MTTRKDGPQVPKYPAAPLKNPAAEADCKLIADVWRKHGAERAVVSFFLVQWLCEPVQWEALAIADRVRTLYHAGA